MGSVSKEIIEQLRQFSTPELSDALNRFRIKGGCQGIKPVMTGSKIVGPALTVRKLPADPVNPKKSSSSYLDIAKEGDVVVIDNSGRMDCTIFGDILAFACKHAGLEGTVINGCCRDIDGQRVTGYPVFSKGTYMQTGKDLTQDDAFNVPIGIGDVLVKPGDIIVADDSGVLVIPQELVKKVLGAAEEINAAETLIKKSVDKGLEKEDAHLSLTEARKKYGYHDLQRPKE
ncbi:RraA family protein [Thermodesulfobacteriota bacterium]